MRHKRPAALLLALTLLFGQTSAAFAYEDVSGSSYNEIVKEVSDEENVGGFLFDVSEGDISSSEWDVSGSEIPEQEEKEIDEPEKSFEEWHGHSTEDILSAPEEILRDSEKSALYYRSYYNQLNELGKLLYTTLGNNLNGFADPEFTIVVNLGNFSNDLRTEAEVREAFRNAFAAYDYDHPEVFWLRPSAFAYIRTANATTGITNKITIKLSSKMTSFYQAPYDTNPDRIYTDKALMDTYVSEIVSEARKRSSFDEKIKYINDRIVNDNYYNRYVARGQNSNASNLAWESTSALTSQTWLKSASDYGSKDAPVCEGYSRAFKLICNRLGIYCIQVAGNAHMWNYVQDHTGTWYAVDTTWDDPVRSDEYSTKNTPADQIHKYVLVGSKTVINGSTFISRHPANGAFWKDGTAFSVPELCECTYFENEILRNCDFFVGLADDREAQITIYDDEFAYFSDIYEATSYVKSLAAENPSRKVIMQLNRDVTISEGSLSEIEGLGNVVLAVNAKKLTFEISDNIYVPDVDIRDSMGTGFEVRLTQNLAFSGTGIYQDAVIVLGDYELILENDAKLSAKSIIGSYLTMRNNAVLLCENICISGNINLSSSKVYLTGGVSEISGITLSNDAFLLLSDDAKTVLQKSIESEFVLNIGLIIPEEQTESYFFTLNENSLPLSGDDFVLFETKEQNPKLNCINILSSTDEMRAVFEAGVVYARALSMALYALNIESSTRVFLEKFTSLSDAISFIDALGNKGKDYLLALTRNVYAQELTIPDGIKSLRVAGVASFADDTTTLREITLSGDADISGVASFECVGLHAVNLNAGKTLAFGSCNVVISNNLSADKLELTDTVITVGGLVSIKELVSKTASNAIYFGENGDNYITENGRIKLLKNGYYSESFDSIQAALNHISAAKDAGADYTIVIVAEASAEEKTTLHKSNFLIPDSKSAKSITVKAEGEARHVYFKNALSLNTEFSFENVILAPAYSKIGIDLKGKNLKLSSVTFDNDAVLKNVSDSAGSANSSLILENCSVAVAGESSFGILCMDENSVFENRAVTSIGRITRPMGTIRTYVTAKKSMGRITSLTPTLSINKDFSDMTGAGLFVVAVDAKTGTEIDYEAFSSSSLSEGKLAVMKAPKLTPSVYDNENIYNKVIITGSLATDTTKVLGNFVFSNIETSVLVLYDTNRAQAVQNANRAVQEINSTPGKKAYKILLTGTDYGTLSSLPDAAKASELTIAGMGKTLNSKKNLSADYPVCVDNIILKHRGNLLLKQLKEQNGAQLFVTGKLETGNIISENSLTIGNTVDSKKNSQITVSGTVMSATPIIVELFSDNAQKDFFVHTKKHNILINAGRKTKASAFRASVNNIPEGYVYINDSNFNENGYLLTNTGNAVRVIYSGDVVNALVRGVNTNGVLPVPGAGEFLGYFSDFDSAVKTIDLLNDTSSEYSVVLLKDIEEESLSTPSRAAAFAVVGKDGAECKLNVTGKTSILCDTVIANLDVNLGKASLRSGTILNLNLDDSDNCVFSNVSGSGATLTIDTQRAETFMSGKVNVDTLKVMSGALSEAKVTFNGTVTAKNLCIYEGVSPVFGGKTSLGNIECTSGVGTVFYKRPAKGLPLLTVSGQLDGSIKFSMLTDLGSERYVIETQDEGYTPGDSKRLMNFSGTYNKNHLEFSIVSGGTETNLVAKNYVFTSGNALFWASSEAIGPDNLIVLGGGDISTPDDYSGAILMNFTDVSKATAYITKLNRKNAVYTMLVGDNYRFAKKLTLPNASSYSRLVIAYSGENPKDCSIRKIIGKGNVVLRDFHDLIVTESMNLTGSLELENTVLRVPSKAGTYSVKADALSQLFVAGTEYNETLEDIRVALMLTDGSLVGYFGSINGAVKCINDRNRKDAEYIIEIISAEEEIFPNGSALSALKISPKAKTVTVTTKSGRDNAILVVENGVISKGGEATLIFDRVTLEGRKTDNSLTKLSITVKNGRVLFTDRTRTKTQTGVKNYIEVSDFSASRGSLGLYNTGLISSGKLSAKEVVVNGDSYIKASKTTTMGNVAGSGRLYINQLTTKAARTKSETLLNISGVVSENVKIGIIPYEYTDSLDKKILSSEDVEAILLKRAAAPKAYTKLVNAPKTASERFFICDEEKQDYIVETKRVHAYKYGTGIYCSIEDTPIKLLGYGTNLENSYEGSFMTLNEAFTEIDRLKKKNNYTVVLSDDVGMHNPEKLAWPSRAKAITLKNEGPQKILRTSTGISLRCATEFDGVVPEYLDEQNRISVGTIKLNKMTVSFKNIDNTSSAGFKILGAGKVSVNLLDGEEFVLIKQIKSVSDFEISGAGTVSLGTGEIKAGNITACDASLKAKNITVSKEMLLENASVIAGNDACGTGCVKLKNIVIFDSNSEIIAKQDQKGDTLLNISGKIKKAPDSQEDYKLTIGLLYNNSVNYAQWYKGMRVASSTKADVEMLTLKYDNTTPGMGERVDGFTLLRRGKYIVID